MCQGGMSVLTIGDPLPLRYEEQGCHSMDCSWFAVHSGILLHSTTSPSFSVSYGCEVWGTLCSGNLQPGLKGMAGLQIAFFCQLKLSSSISPHVIFAELAEAPWQRTWWSQVLGFMHRLDSVEEGSLHPDILSDNIHDASGHPGFGNWAAGIQDQFGSLGMPSPFSGGRIRHVDHQAVCKAMPARDVSIWGGLHISPNGAPSRGAKLCTYLRWFARPDNVSTEPYYELPLPVTKLRSIFHFRVGAHSLLVEQGRIEMLAQVRILCDQCYRRQAPLCL